MYGIAYRRRNACVAEGVGSQFEQEQMCPAATGELAEQRKRLASGPAETGPFRAEALRGDCRRSVRPRSQRSHEGRRGAA
jgi:hypothetical protein